MVGEILEEVEAVEEYFFVFDGESFGDCIDGMFGPIDVDRYTCRHGY